jgi:NAD(P)-dependent dehydrogenase (short-subunit alcohol dehydrogenase family)
VKLQGRRIIVVGAAGGMGAAVARLFQGEGAALALLDRDEARLAETARDTGAFQRTCDLADAAGVGRAVAEAVGALGGLDGLVNAAGLLVSKDFQNLDPDDWNRMLAVNLSGPYHVIRSALPALQAAEAASIVNIASVSGWTPMAGTAGYSASKAGLIMLGKSLALELGPRIRVNTICPGVVRTEMTRYIWENPEHTRRAAERVALQTLGQPEDIAQAALFLSSDDSRFTTGSEIVVDGGFSWR